MGNSPSSWLKARIYSIHSFLLHYQIKNILPYERMGIKSKRPKEEEEEGNKKCYGPARVDSWK
jgi:hypothetical protein